MRRIVTAILWLIALCCAAAAQHSSVPSFQVGTNLDPVNNVSSEQPFLNILKTGFYNTRNNAGATTGEEQLLYTSFLDASGFPTALTGGPTHTFVGVSETILFSLSSAIAPHVYYPAGDYLLQWTGTGQFQTIAAISDANVVCSSTSSPCVIHVSTPSDNGLAIELTSTGAGASYAKNWSLIYCGTYTAGNPAGQRCSKTNAAGTPVDTLESQCEAGTYTSCFNPDFLARLNGVKSIRFMQWLLGNPGDFQQSWSTRRLPGWYTWANNESAQNVYLNGAYPIDTFAEMVPAEVLFGLCNALNTDCWFCIPSNADDNWVTQFGTLAHSSLNTNLRAYVEFSNEIWNFVQGHGQTGEITAKIDNGSGSAGNILTVTVIGPDGSTPILHSPLVLNGTGLPNFSGNPTTQIVSQLSGTTGGVGTYQVTGSPLLISSETMTVNVNVISNQANSGAAFYTSNPPNAGAAELWGERARAVQVGHLFQAAWGGDSNRVIRIAAGQNGFGTGGTPSSDCILSSIPNGTSHCDANLGGPSFWYGSTAGTVAQNVDAYTVAPYWNNDVPDAWTADPDGGLNSFFAYALAGANIPGGILPHATVTGNCGNGAGETCTPVDTAHYTLTTGLSLSADPPNGFPIQATVNNLNNTTSSGHTFLTVDSMAQYPILLDDGGCPGDDIGASWFPGPAGFYGTSQFVFVFTSAISGCSGGSITKGWRPFAVETLSGGIQYGMMPFTIALAQINCQNVSTYGNGIPLVAYEGGQQFTSTHFAVPSVNNPLTILLTNAMRDPRMGTAYEQMFRGWSSLSGGCTTGPFIQFNDIEQITVGNQEWWGTLENVTLTRAPRYDTMVNFWNGNPGGGLH